jgi:hypothetical protein
MKTPASLVLAAMGMSLALNGLAQSTNNQPATAVPVDPEVVSLSPFVVNTARDTSWRAATTLIGNRTNQELIKLPMTVDAITSEFMRDLQLASTEDAARFVSGLTVLPRFESRTDDNRITYRGLNSTSTSSRNFFLWYVPVDTYNVERLDFNKGSNSLMFGNSAPGGQSTAFTKQPRDYRFGAISASVGSNDSYRFQADFNQPITKQLSVRVNLVERKDQTYVDRNFQHLAAQTVAIAYAPFRNTRIRVEGEHGRYERRRADNALAIQEVAAPGLGLATNNRWYYTSDGTVIQRTSSLPAAIDRSGASGVILPLLEGMTQSILLPNGSRKTFSGLAKTTNVLGSGDYLDRPYNAFTATLEQKIGDLAIEYAFNQQRQQQERNDVSFGTTSSPPVVQVDGTGRPFMDLDGSNTYKIFSNVVQTHRLTLAYPFELGHWAKEYLVITGTQSRDAARNRRFNLVNDAATGSLANAIVRVRAYLDDPAYGSQEYWDRLLPGNLPTSANFRPILNEVYLNTSPLVDIRYSRAANATLSGEYFDGRLVSLLGAGYEKLSRKIPIDSIYTADSRGRYAAVPDPEDAPELYRYDPKYEVDANTLVAGLTWAAVRHANFGLNLYGVYSESFNWQAAQTFNGQNLGPITGDTKEIGIKGDLAKQKLFYSLAFYEINRRNAAYSWTPDLLSNTQLEDLFNPNNLLPSDPGYFAVTTGLNNERRTINSEENSRGFDFTLQGQRTFGLQARATFSYTKVRATRDFTAFQALLDAAIARTNAANAAGGNPAMAESATFIANAQNILLSNTNTTEVTGLRSAPYSGSWILDYELPRRMGLRLGASGVWVPNYNVTILNGVPYRAGGSHQVDFYAIYTRKVKGARLTFNFNVRNAYDLANGSSARRKSGALSTSPAGGPNYLYRYTDPTTFTFSTSVQF